MCSNVLDTAVLLHTGPAEGCGIDAAFVQLEAHVVVMGFFAPMFEEESAADQRMGQVTNHRTGIEGLGVGSGHTAAFRVRQCDKAGQAFVAAEFFGVKPFGDQLRDLPRAETRRQNESHVFAAEPSFAAQGLERKFRGRGFVGDGDGCSRGPGFLA